MKKIWILMAVFAFGAAAAFLSPPTIQGHKSKIRKAAQAIPNRYVVILDPSALQARRETSSTKAGKLAARHGGAVDKVFNSALQGFSAEMTPEAAEAMSTDPGVLFIEEDSYISVNNVQENAPWGLDRVDQRSVPLNNAYSYARTGSGVHVYVIDTGIRSTHVEFGGRATKDFDSIGDGQNGNDCHGHGTHVAATIAGTNYGIAKSASVHGVRVLACNGLGTVSSAVEGIDWVTANHISPAVVNMSMGSGASLLMDYAVQGSIDSGVTYVVAAGNSSSDACQVSPARVPAAVTVGASDQNDVKAGFSNFGSCVDLFAPGVGIVSAWNWYDDAIFYASGTSMAAPHVAGAAALFLEENPNATPAQAAAGLMGHATTGMMGPMTDGSPNMMLFTAPNGPTAADAEVTGRVVADNGRGLKNVVVRLLRASDGRVVSSMTNAFGYFRFDQVTTGEFYVLYVQNKRYSFADSPYSFSVTDNYVAPTFVGTLR